MKSTEDGARSDPLLTHQGLLILYHWQVTESCCVEGEPEMPDSQCVAQEPGRTPTSHRHRLYPETLSWNAASLRDGALQSSGELPVHRFFSVNVVPLGVWGVHEKKPSALPSSCGKGPPAGKPSR